MNNSDHHLSQVAAVLESQGFNDAANIAKFVISIARFCQNAADFHVQLKANGAEIPCGVAATVWEAMIRPDVPELNMIYKGKVGSINNNCFLVNLYGFRGEVQGLLVHVGENAVRQGQEVYVRALRFDSDQTLILSLAGVDQRTGKDLNSPVAESSGEKEIKIDVDIELNDEIPGFLRGNSDYFADLTPVEIFKDPKGSLSNAASVQSELFEQRREVYDQFKLAFLDNLQSLRAGPLRPRPSAATVARRRESLPIHKVKEEFIRAVNESQVVVVVGESGSGKTTQLPQYLAEAGYTLEGRKIVCSQPGEEAPRWEAIRVAEELRCRVGERVGYTTRTGPDTAIIYATEAELLREIYGGDLMLSWYSVVVLDQVHERTILTDVLLRVMKAVLDNRPDFRVVVSTAKDLDKCFFPGCRVDVRVPIETFPVEIVHAEQPVHDYVEAALSKVLEIHTSKPEGDIILFLTGRDEIDYARQILHDKTQSLSSVPFVLPAYSSDRSEISLTVFAPAPPGRRKVVLAVSHPEASLVVPGVMYVVDPGFMRLHVYDTRLGMDTLVVAPISQGLARGRTRLAGRSGLGKCYRLYTKKAFREEMVADTPPEIRRRSLTDAALRMCSLDLTDPPVVQVAKSALRQLYCLGAVDEAGMRTEVGRRMGELGVGAAMAKMLVAGVELGCGEEMVTVVALLRCGGDVLVRGAEADEKRGEEDGDHLRLVWVYEAWEAADDGSTLLWCMENNVRLLPLQTAQKDRLGISRVMRNLGMSIVSAGGNTAAIRKAVAAGLFFHAARKEADGGGGYRTVVGNQTVHIHPRSALYRRQPRWVVYDQVVVVAGREYMRGVTAIDPTWLPQVAPNFFRAVTVTR